MQFGKTIYFNTLYRLIKPGIQLPWNIIERRYAMIISSINVSDIYDYNKVSSVSSELSHTDIPEKSTQSPTALASDIEEYSSQKILPIKEVTDFAIEKLSIDKELIGSESDINGLDVQKEVSDMQKDSILQQYQYFVGNISTEDGMVIRR